MPSLTILVVSGWDRGSCGICLKVWTLATNLVLSNHHLRDIPVDEPTVYQQNSASSLFRPRRLALQAVGFFCVCDAPDFVLVRLP